MKGVQVSRRQLTSQSRRKEKSDFTMHKLRMFGAYQAVHMHRNQVERDHVFEQFGARR